jgi:hypothetical protein
VTLRRWVIEFWCFNAALCPYDQGWNVQGFRAYLVFSLCRNSEDHSMNIALRVNLILYVYGSDAESGHFRASDKGVMFLRLARYLFMQRSLLCLPCWTGSKFRCSWSKLYVRLQFLPLALNLFNVVFLWLILRRHPYLRLSLCRVILCGTMIDDSSKGFGKKRSWFSRGTVPTFGWRR